MEGILRNIFNAIERIERALCCAFGFSGDGSGPTLIGVLGDILKKLCDIKDILAAQEEGEELITCDLCDEDGNYTGTIIQIWDEDTDTFSETYLDASGAQTDVKPEGTKCNGRPDYEYKWDISVKCIEVDGECKEIKEVFCEIFKGPESIGDPITYWVIDGVKTEDQPDFVDCDECKCDPKMVSFLASDGAPADCLFHNFSLMIPACCEIKITTSAGEYVFDKQDCDRDISEEFDCLLSDFKIDGEPKCLSKIRVYLKKRK